MFGTGHQSAASFALRRRPARARTQQIKKVEMHEGIEGGIPLSVLMPVFNAEAYVAAATQSILSQTFADFEFIVVDDGSTDSSLEILQKYAASDARIRLVSRENRGLVATLNEMIALAGGRYLARMDADDISHPLRFARQIEYLEHHPDIAVLGTRGLFIDPEGAPLVDFLDVLQHDAILAALLTPALGIIHPAAMIRRDVMLDIGGYRADCKHAEDLDLWLRISESHRLCNLDQVLISYRVHANSVSKTHHMEQWRTARRIVDDALRRRGLPPAAERPPIAPLISPAETHRMWAWWALNAGNLPTARKHAMRALLREPMKTDTWRVAAHALRESMRGWSR